MTDVDVAREKAREALKLAEQTLKEANDTLFTLQEFDQLVEQSKEEAAKAIESIPDIERLIADAENKTQLANNALGKIFYLKEPAGHSFWQKFYSRSIFRSL